MEYFELGELGHVNYISRVIHIYIHIELNYRTIFRVIQSYIHRLELHLIIPLKKKHGSSHPSTGPENWSRKVEMADFDGRREVSCIKGANWFEAELGECGGFHPRHHPKKQSP